jgi:hypothetical protein
MSLCILGKDEVHVIDASLLGPGGGIILHFGCQYRAYWEVRDES